MDDRKLPQGYIVAVLNFPLNLHFWPLQETGLLDSHRDTSYMRNKQLRCNLVKIRIYMQTVIMDIYVHVYI